MFHRHDWQDITTPWNHLSVTHLQCLKCGKLITAFHQLYKRRTQGRIKPKTKGEDNGDN